MELNVVRTGKARMKTAECFFSNLFCQMAPIKPTKVRVGKKKGFPKIPSYLVSSPNTKSFTEFSLDDGSITTTQRTYVANNEGSRKRSSTNTSSPQALPSHDTVNNRGPNVSAKKPQVSVFGLRRRIVINPICVDDVGPIGTIYSQFRQVVAVSRRFRGQPIGL